MLVARSAAKNTWPGLGIHAAVAGTASTSYCNYLVYNYLGIIYR